MRAREGVMLSGLCRDEGWSLWAVMIAEWVFAAIFVMVHAVVFGAMTRSVCVLLAAYAVVMCVCPPPDVRRAVRGDVLLRGVVYAMVLWIMVVAVMRLARDYTFWVFAHSGCFYLAFAFALLLYRVVSRRVVRWWCRCRGMKRHVLMVGWSESMARISAALQSETEWGYAIDACLGYDASVTAANALAEVETYMNDRGDATDEMLCAYTMADREVVDALMRLCRTHGVHLHLVPDVGGSCPRAWVADECGDAPIMTLHRAALEMRPARAVKRVCDVVVALCALVLLAPVFLLVGLKVKYDSRGRVLARKRLFHLDGTPFVCYDFSTMIRTDGEWRETRFGSWLRRTGLARLPRLFSVLTGTMSVVGTRPIMDEMLEESRKAVEAYALHRVAKAGMLTWGGESDSVQQRVASDVWYMDHWSLWLDVYVCWLFVAGRKK